MVVRNGGQVPETLNGIKDPQKSVRVQEMPLSCEDYRHQQQLLALKKRLAENKLEPEEREEIEKAIQELERKLKM